MPTLRKLLWPRIKDLRRERLLYKRVGRSFTLAHCLVIVFKELWNGVPSLRCRRVHREGLTPAVETKNPAKA